jgi:hypothetical protein
MRTPKLLLPNQNMHAAVPRLHLSRGEVPSEDVFLHVVDLEVAEGFPVPAADGREGVARGEVRTEKLFLDVLRAGAAPELADARVVHPFV